MNIIKRLESNGWKAAITTQTHLMYFKKDWQCTIHQITGKVLFKRLVRTSVSLYDLLEGVIE